MKRKSFLKSLGLGGAAVLAAPFVSLASKKGGALGEAV